MLGTSSEDIEEGGLESPYAWVRRVMVESYAVAVMGEGDRDENGEGMGIEVEREEREEDDGLGV